MRMHARMHILLRNTCYRAPTEVRTPHIFTEYAVYDLQVGLNGVFCLPWLHCHYLHQLCSIAFLDSLSGMILAPIVSFKPFNYNVISAVYFSI